MKPLLALLVITVLAGCSGENSNAPLLSVGAPRYDAIDVSIIQLIAVPQEYSKKAVRIVGYLNIEFEGNAIYLHEEDFSRGLSSNGLWVDAKPEVMDVLKQLSGRYVLLEGIFDASDKGHMSLASGAISDVYRASDWPFHREEKWKKSSTRR